MAPTKKYRVRMRVKVRHRFLKNAGLTLSVCAAAVLLGCSGLWAARAFSAMSPGRFLAFKAGSFSVASPSEEISAEVSRRMAGKMGAPFSRSDAEALAAGLRAAYPSLSRVEVERNFLRGRVVVKAVPENIVAKVRLASGAGAGENLYLAENGRLIPEIYGPEPETAFETELRAGDGLAPLAVFLREFKPLSSGVVSRPVKLEYPALGYGPGQEQGRSCALLLANGASVLWGDFEFTGAKISRLNEVLSDAAVRLKGPIRVDLRYFRDGKVFVSKAGDI